MVQNLVTCHLTDNELKILCWDERVREPYRNRNIFITFIYHGSWCCDKQLICSFVFYKCLTMPLYLI